MHSFLLPLCCEYWHPCLRGMSRLPLILLFLVVDVATFPLSASLFLSLMSVWHDTSLGQVSIITWKWKLIFLWILAWSKDFKEINSVNSILNQIKSKASITAFQLASQGVRCRPCSSPAQTRSRLHRAPAWDWRSLKQSGCMFHDVGHNSQMLAYISYNFVISSFYFFSCLSSCFALQRC